MAKVSDTKSKLWNRQTRLIHGGTRRTEFDETSEGIFMTSGYVYDTAESAESAFKGETSHYIYSRYSNPTVTMFEERLALLEGSDFCVGTSSGMAAVFACLLSQLNEGDRVVASRALFASCHYIIQNLLPNLGIKIDFVDGTDLLQWESALSIPTKVVFLETPSNPTLEIIDLPVFHSRLWIDLILRASFGFFGIKLIKNGFYVAHCVECCREAAIDSGLKGCLHNFFARTTVVNGAF